MKKNSMLFGFFRTIFWANFAISNYAFTFSRDFSWIKSFRKEKCSNINCTATFLFRKCQFLEHVHPFLSGNLQHSDFFISSVRCSVYKSNRKRISSHFWFRQPHVKLDNQLLCLQKIFHCGRTDNEEDYCRTFVSLYNLRRFQ